jgi:hypothetical protein
MGTTLADVIPTVATKPLAKTQRKELFEHRRDLEGLGRYVYRDNDLLKNAAFKLVSRGAELAMAGHALPRGTSDSFDLIKGRSTVQNARSLADQIGFGIFPWSLVRGPYRPPHQFFEPLKTWSSARCVIYIMAPVDAYDLKEHIEHPERDLPMFVPSDARQAFMALGMSIPVFRSLQEQINSLRDKMRDYYDRIQAIERDVGKLHERVTALGKAVAEERIQRVRAEKTRVEPLTRWYSSVSDPLALILPPGNDIEDLDSPLLVGPAWGGDLPAELVRLVTGKPKLLRKAQEKT